MRREEVQGEHPSGGKVCKQPPQRFFLFLRFRKVHQRVHREDGQDETLLKREVAEIRLHQPYPSGKARAGG